MILNKKKIRKRFTRREPFDATDFRATKSYFHVPVAAATVPITVRRNFQRSFPTRNIAEFREPHGNDRVTTRNGVTLLTHY